MENNKDVTAKKRELIAYLEKADEFYCLLIKDNKLVLCSHYSSISPFIEIEKANIEIFNAKFGQEKPLEP